MEKRQTQQPQDIGEQLAELRSLVTETRAQVRAIEACVEKYRPFMDELIESARFWTGIRKEILLNAMKGSVWAILVAVFVVLALGAQKWLKGWLG